MKSNRVSFFVFNNFDADITSKFCLKLSFARKKKTGQYISVSGSACLPRCVP
jgi:hypothetical protein